ncbi:DUF2939 domain-containing protein [Marichromatium bheemlicum]|uniref:DUF2939 domain-containing protein n=1 Tax=Marichromatium bheemlicum TaxID=365339 RepID=A0ABX1I5P5_9GAMM|nr:DUF2939 domain-containing protein [Marichromatium bheemlicum]NKN32904.1 DUF2939 domain-containing protein [Marichromatium bheemlicum]
MMPLFPDPSRFRARWSAAHWRGLGVVLRPLLLALLVLVALYAAWPYATLWRLDRALAADDCAALDELVDLSAIRTEIADRLNKDHDSVIGELSDSFIQWLEWGIRRHGEDALDELVTLDWVCERLQANVPDDAGLFDQLARARFVAPREFCARIGWAEPGAVHVRLRLQGGGWRLVTLYY